MCALWTVAATASFARADGTVLTLDPTSFSTVQITLGANTSLSEAVSATGTIELAAPPTGAGEVVVRNIQLFISPVVLAIPYPVYVGATKITSTPGASAVLSGGSSGALDTLFSGAGPTCSLTGTVSYTGSGPSCLSVLQLGGQCSGTYPLEAVGPRPSMISAGSITPSPVPRTVQLLVSVNTPLQSNGQAWSRLMFDVAVRATLTAPPTCVADFDAPAGVDVQDIFSYLNAWFTNDPRADITGDGLTVQDIFDFLNAWFTGCP